MREQEIASYTPWLACILFIQLDIMDKKFRGLEVTIPPPSPGLLRLPHWKVSLEHRKNWQNKLNKEQELHRHLYDIYPQPELPAADVDKHMRIWLNFLTLMYGRPLSSEDYIFSPISSNGLIQAKSPMSHDTIQKWINSFTTAAGINLMEANLTTHCFRRGGAQFRFMYAPVGKRWTLATIRWWGGWAEGEHRDTLIRYLLDELYYYEENHGDALKPIVREAHVSFMGEHKDMKPITMDELMTVTSSLQHNITHAVISNILSAMHTKRSTPPFYFSTDYYQGPQRTADHNPSIPGRTISLTPSPINSIPTSSMKAPLPPGVYVPNIGKEIKKSDRWKIVIQQWEIGDPSVANGLPLRDWPDEWTKNPAIAVKYRDRMLVASEFIENCGRNESVFLAQWPAATQGIKQLHAQMLAVRKAAGLAKSRCSRKSQTTDGDSKTEL
ncbi:hypothetical protein Clacol_007819 [Clathrus columnatus]|uniref:Integrase n=1 Tax=Clathrus columnatus TaxID=1419009 RepID=A0AAV5AKB0_9AGAM|nr:hypothetical protein Clacol_007819 [Clathrus columnatus]